ncbi:MAG TPA: HU family DNA-binding protein [Acidimicrobiales bacterium]|nr:HU family DNA-binding protein [Acidimicrobiales bacterium]
MNKAELVAKVAAEASVSAKEAEAVLDAFFGTVTTAAKGGDKVAWPGFGTFQGKNRPARDGRNPATGAAIKIPASTVMHFGASSTLKATLNP